LPTPLDIYVAPATERRGLWRLFVGLVIIIAGWLLWTVLVMSAFVLYKLAAGLAVTEALTALKDFVESASPASVIFQLSTFAGVWPAVWLAVRLLHGQSFGSLLSPERRMRWGDFLGGVGLALGFWVITLTLGIVAVGAPERSALPLATWALTLAPLALAVFFQASAEELVFRGYILQQLAARWASPLVWAALPAFLFGLAHYANGSQSGIGVHYVLVTLAFGLTAAALVWRTGSLAAAMGLHTGMNMLSLSGVGLKGLIEGNQLFLYDDAGAKTLFLADGAGTVCILLFILSPLCPFRPRQVLAG